MLGNHSRHFQQYQVRGKRGVMVLVGKKEGRQAPIMECPSRPLVLPVLLGCQ